jgi:hypothetical protein
MSEQPASNDERKTEQVKSYLKSFSRPSYHVKSLIEDFQKARHGLANWDLDELNTDRDAFAGAFRGRLFSTYLLSGFIGALGVVTGQVTQYVTASPYLGFFVGLLGANLFATIAFQAIWASAHAKMYSTKGATFWTKFIALERDILPLQWDGFRLAFLLITLTAPIMLGAIWLALRYAPDAAVIIPFPVISAGLEMIIVHSSLIRIMGDLFERHSWKIADRHLL